MCVYNIDDIITMFWYFGDVVSNSRSFLKVHKLSRRFCLWIWFDCRLIRKWC